jgi:hypothetical protein
LRGDGMLTSFSMCPYRHIDNHRMRSAGIQDSAGFSRGASAKNF